MFCWIDLLKYGKCNTDLYSDVAFVLKIEKKASSIHKTENFLLTILFN